MATNPNPMAQPSAGELRQRVLSRQGHVNSTQAAALRRIERVDTEGGSVPVTGQATAERKLLGMIAMTDADGVPITQDHPVYPQAALIHYALDLESPPFIACEAPDATKWTTEAGKVTCPDCMSHEEFPQSAVLIRVTARAVLMNAADLLSETGENPEYDRAIVELTSALIGAGPDDRTLVTRILRALTERD